MITRNKTQVVIALGSAILVGLWVKNMSGSDLLGLIGGVPVFLFFAFLFS